MAAAANGVDFLANKSHCVATMNVATKQESAPDNARLRELVASSGLIQKVIAERAGIRQDVLSQLLAGDRKFTWYYVARLAPVFGVSMESLAGGGE